MSTDTAEKWKIGNLEIKKIGTGKTDKYQSDTKCKVQLWPVTIISKSNVGLAWKRRTSHRLTQTTGWYYICGFKKNHFFKTLFIFVY